MTKHELLNRAGYRSHGRTWRMLIHADGPPGLSTTEQEINRKGGRSYGTDAGALLRDTADEFRMILSEFSTDEIAESDLLTFYRDWLNDYSNLLSSRQQTAEVN